MISLGAYWGKGLASLDAALRHQVVGSGGFDVHVLDLADEAQAKEGATNFHASRWPGSHDGMSVTARAGDAAELLVGLDIKRCGGYEPTEVFVRCLSSAGRRVSEPGIDVTAFRVEDLGDEPLTESERLHFGEVKHTTSADTTSAHGSLQQDLGKTTDERVRDELALVISYLELHGNVLYPERVNKFLDSHSLAVLGVLFDEHEIVEDVPSAAARRFSGTSTRNGVTVAWYVASFIPRLYTWIRGTL